MFLAILVVRFCISMMLCLSKTGFNMFWCDMSRLLPIWRTVMHVLQADRGVDLDFLVGGTGNFVPVFTHHT